MVMSFWWQNFPRTWSRFWDFRSKRWRLKYKVISHGCLFNEIISSTQNGFLSSVPYLGMWITSLILSTIADWLITSKKLSITSTRKLLNTIGQFGPAICLAVVSYTGCNRVLTVFLLTVGISFNGGIYSGFKVSVNWRRNLFLLFWQLLYFFFSD